MEMKARRRTSANHKFLEDSKMSFREVFDFAFKSHVPTPQAFAIKVTECLWAKTFRDLAAGELGYLLICHPDYAYCEGFNPRIAMSRSMTLMEGDNCCNHRWVWRK
ncbi:MAG: L-2-amino-thiazoline-4-carboxylic acid hydrolase [bacterium]